MISEVVVVAFPSPNMPPCVYDLTLLELELLNRSDTSSLWKCSETPVFFSGIWKNSQDSRMKMLRLLCSESSTSM